MSGDRLPFGAPPAKIAAGVGKKLSFDASDDEAAAQIGDKVEVTVDTKSGSGSSSSSSSGSSSSSSSGSSSSSSSSNSSKKGDKKSKAKMAAPALAPAASDPAANIGAPMVSSHKAKKALKSGAKMDGAHKKHSRKSGGGSAMPKHMEGRGASMVPKKSRTKLIELEMTTSLMALAQLENGVTPRVVCKNVRAAEHLGSIDLPASSMRVISVENYLPVKIGLLAPHLKNNEHNVITAAGAFLTVADPLSTSRAEPLYPVQLHAAEQSAWQLQMQKHYPGQTPATMIAGIQPGHDEGKSKISASSALMMPIRNKIEKEAKAAKAKKIPYSGPTLTSMALFEGEKPDPYAYHVGADLVEYATNYMTTKFASTKDTINIANELFVNFARADIAGDTTANPKLWADVESLKANPKVASVQQALERVGTVKVLVAVDYLG